MINKNKKRYLVLEFLIIIVLISLHSLVVYAYDLSADHEVNLYYQDSEAVAKIQKQIWGEMRTWGMTEEGCAGVIGNMMAESGCDYTRTQGNVPWSKFKKGSTGIGLTQWTYPTRQDGLFAKADELGKQWNTLIVQMSYLKMELSSGYDILYSSNSVNDCSDYFLSNYENPAVYNTSERRKLSNTVYEQLKGTEPKSLDGSSLDSETETETGEDVVVTEENISAIVDEWDLIGMPPKSAISTNKQEVELVSRKDLTIGQQYSVQLAGDDIALQKKALSIDKARVSVVFIGMVFVFYSVLLLMCMLFDRANSFIDISLIGVVSFGLLIYSDEEGTLGRKGYISTKRLFLVIVLICIIGMLLISGGVLPFMMNLVNKGISIFMN